MLKQNGGYSIIEILVAFTVMALSLTFTMSFIFGVRQKAILRADTEKLVGALHFARQQSIAAYKGQSHGIEFQYPDTYIIVPEQTRKSLRSGVKFTDDALVTRVMFEKLSGSPEQPVQIHLTSAGLTSIIDISSEGFISASEPEKL